MKLVTDKGLEMMDEYIRLKRKELLDNLANEIKVELLFMTDKYHETYEYHYDRIKEDLLNVVKELGELKEYKETLEVCKVHGVPPTDEDEPYDEEFYGDDEDNETYVLTEKGKLMAMLTDDSYKCIDGNSPIYADTVAVMKKFREIHEEYDVDED